MKQPIPTNREKTFSENELIISKTDARGKITYGNEIFIELSGYTEKELLNAPHNIVRHPEMPKVVFKLLWDTVKTGKEIHAYVKNLSKDGSYYWVFANITPSYDSSGNIIGYYSVRRKPSIRAINDVIIPLYQELLNAERIGGVNNSQKLLSTILLKKGLTYEEFILSI